MTCKYCDAELPHAGGAPVKCGNCGRFNVSLAASDEPTFMSLSEAPDVERDRLGAAAFWGPIFNGGWVYRQLVMVGGPPGGGKSTWAIQVCEAHYDETGKPGLYLASEEAEADIRERCERIGVDPQCVVIPTTRQDESLACLEEAEDQFSVAVVDSVPDFVGFNLNKGVELLHRLKRFCVDSNTPVLCIDHVNKGEELAGLERWKHVVDTTVLIDGDELTLEKVMRIAGKNRFGPGNARVKLIMRDRDEENPGRLYLHPEEIERAEALERRKREIKAKKGKASFLSKHAPSKKSGKKS